MIEKLQTWIAGPKERQRAMIISAACILLVVLVVFMQIMAPEEPSGVQTQPKIAKFAIPPKPQDAPVRPAQPEVAKRRLRPAVITPATPVKTTVPAKAARPAKTPPPAKTTGKVKKLAYYVQIGAFRGHKNALAYMKRLQKQGWATSVHLKKNGMYGVLVGPWESFALAEVTKKKLKTQKIEGFTIKKTIEQ